MKKATRQQYASAAKARRQKQILALLGVVLVGVLVIQGPKMLNLLNGSSNTPASTTPATSSTPPSSGAAPPTATPATGLPGTALAATATGIADASPPRSPSQLYSFEVFSSKDPFVQQVSTTPAVTVPSASVPSPTPTVPAAPPTKKTTTPASTTPAGAAPASSTYATPAQAVAAVTPTGATAVIDVNGQSDAVSAGQAFPAANPTFRLVSIHAGTALIGLVGGAYASGTATVTLVSGHTLTLVDTTDGVRYELRLVAVSG